MPEKLTIIPLTPPSSARLETVAARCGHTSCLGESNKEAHSSCRLETSAPVRAASNGSATGVFATLGFGFVARSLDGVEFGRRQQAINHPAEMVPHRLTGAGGIARP
jgi:hypothetical protein